MKILTVVILVTLSSTAFAQGSGLKAGLWEMKRTSMVIDGKDMNAQMSAAQAQMQQHMEQVSPEQRAQMQAMMEQHGSHGMMNQQGARQICISPAMARKNNPVVDSGCEPAKLKRNGNKSSFEINCTKNGRKVEGKGESTYNNDTVNTHMDMTTTDDRGSKHMQMEMQMTYLGTDCQGIKPADELIK